MEQILKQDPLFNLSNLEFFNLSLRTENLEWEKYIEDMLLLRYINLRYSHIHKNYEMLLYFLNLVEGNLLIFKAKKAVEYVNKIKKKLMIRDNKITNDYVLLINLIRVVYTYIIQLLYDRNIRLNGNQIQKFLVLDSELDSQEKDDVGHRLMKYNYINTLIDTSKQIDYRNIPGLQGIEW